jgi:hypothetical protein
MPSHHASARSLARPPANYESLIFCNSCMMSSGGNSPLEFFDAFGLPVPDGGGSTSVPADWRPFKVSLMASNKRSMRASSGDGGVDGACVDVLLTRPFRVLTILYDLTCITPKVVRVSSRMFHIGAT